MPTARAGFGLAVVGSKIYAIGGTDWLASNEEYDTTHDNWTEKAPMPTARAYFGIASYHGKIYVIGGFAGRTNETSEGSPSSANEVYDPSTNTWETRTPLPAPRQKITAIVVDGKIYVFGGGITDMYIYDIETDVWSNKTSINDSQFITSSTVLDKKMYFYINYLNYLLTYDAATDTWGSTQSFSPRLTSSAIAATTGINEVKGIYVIGGVIAGKFDIVSLAYIYNPETDNWTSGPELPTVLSGAVAATVNDSIYVMGGTQTSLPIQSYLRETLQYTPTSYGTANLPSPSPSPSPTPTPTPTQTPPSPSPSSSISPSSSPSQPPTSSPSPSPTIEPSPSSFPSQEPTKSPNPSQPLLQDAYYAIAIPAIILIIAAAALFLRKSPNKTKAQRTSKLPDV
jgi:N-acetylneuraminic acid mutarotase